MDCRNGLKQEKITEELIIINGWLEELSNANRHGRGEHSN